MALMPNTNKSIYVHTSGSPTARRSLMASNSCFQWKYPVDATYDEHGDGMLSRSPPPASLSLSLTPLPSHFPSPSLL